MEVKFDLDQIIMIKYKLINRNGFRGDFLLVIDGGK